MRRLALALLIVTVLYNAAEGVLSISAGIASSSVVLVAFGADSYLEVLAAGAVIWRLSYTDDEAGEAVEARVLRLIGVTFLVLAAAVVFQSVYSLATARHAQESGLGVAVLLASLIAMPLLAFAKLWVAARANMPVVAAEARETLACAYLTLTALFGVAALYLIGWWWLDAVAALLMVPWLVKEGREGLAGENCAAGVTLCFCRRCTFGIRQCGAACCDPAASPA